MVALSEQFAVACALVLFLPEIYAATIDKDSLFTYHQNESWSLAPAGDQPVQSIEDLRDGIYSLSLAEVRSSSCGGSRPGMRCQSNDWKQSGQRAGIYLNTWHSVALRV